MASMWWGFTTSSSLPKNGRQSALANVANIYNRPNSPWLRSNAACHSETDADMKYVWPRLEKYVSTKPPATQRKLRLMNVSKFPLPGRLDFRVRIGSSRSESIERGSQLLVADTKRPLHGVFLNLVATCGLEPTPFSLRKLLICRVIIQLLPLSVPSWYQEFVPGRVSR